MSIGIRHSVDIVYCYNRKCYISMTYPESKTCTTCGRDVTGGFIVRSPYRPPKWLILAAVARLSGSLIMFGTLIAVT